MSIQMYSEKNRDELLRFVAGMAQGNNVGLTKERALYILPSLCLIYAENGTVPGLTTNDVAHVYALLEELTCGEERLQSLKTLALFAEKNKGNPMSLWDLALLYDHDSLVVGAVAHAKLTLCPDVDKLAGIKSLVNYIEEHACYHALEGLFLTCDLRVMPALYDFWARVNEPEAVLNCMMTPCISLPAVQFLEHIITTTSSERVKEKALYLLCRIPERARISPPTMFLYGFPDFHSDYDTPQIVDAICPMPSWKFTIQAPQVVHTWTCPEYLKRMESTLKEKLSSEQWASLKEAYLASSV